MTFPTFMAWERCVREAKASELDTEKQAIMFAGVRAVVTHWGIEGYDLDNPAATPRGPVLMLLAWLIREIGAVINGSVNPKVLPPESTNT
jgi:hypothetical protein